jgi:hypothetical protein
VCKGSFERDRDSHDAGLEPFRGKRLVVAEELKNSMTLDAAPVKDWFSVVRASPALVLVALRAPRGRP